MQGWQRNDSTHCEISYVHSALGQQMMLHGAEWQASSCVRETTLHDPEPYTLHPYKTLHSGFGGSGFIGFRVTLNPKPYKALQDYP